MSVSCDVILRCQMLESGGLVFLMGWSQFIVCLAISPDQTPQRKHSAT